MLARLGREQVRAGASVPPPGGDGGSRSGAPSWAAPRRRQQHRGADHPGGSRFSALHRIRPPPEEDRGPAICRRARPAAQGSGPGVCASRRFRQGYDFRPASGPPGRRPAAWRSDSLETGAAEALFVIRLARRHGQRAARAGDGRDRLPLRWTPPKRQPGLRGARHGGAGGHSSPAGVRVVRPDARAGTSLALMDDCARLPAPAARLHAPTVARASGIRLMEAKARSECLASLRPQCIAGRHASRRQDQPPEVKLARVDCRSRRP